MSYEAWRSNFLFFLRFWYSWRFHSRFLLTASQFNLIIKSRFFNHFKCSIIAWTSRFIRSKQMIVLCFLFRPCFNHFRLMFLTHLLFNHYIYLFLHTGYPLIINTPLIYFTISFRIGWFLNFLDLLNLFLSDWVLCEW
jgi:hypothetical protein